MIKVVIRYWDGVVKEYFFDTKEEGYWFIHTSGDAVSDYSINYVEKD